MQIIELWKTLLDIKLCSDYTIIMKTKSIKVSEKAHKKLRLLSAKTGYTIIEIVDAFMVGGRHSKIKTLTINN